MGNEHEEHTKLVEMQLGLTMLIHQKVLEDEYNPDAYLDDYLDKIVISGEEGTKHALLNEYLYVLFPIESDHINTMTLVIFAKLMDIDFSDVLDLVAMHPTKHSTTGLSKIRKELQGVNKKVFTDVVMDYIEMMKEAGMPLINEEHLIATKDRYSTLAEFWHIYGAMANLVDKGANYDANESALKRFREKLSSLAEGIEYENFEDFKQKLEVIKEQYFASKAVVAESVDKGANYDANESALKRFNAHRAGDANESALKRFREKISDDKNVLYPLLAYLYSQWANDRDFFENFKLSLLHTDGFNGVEAEYFDTVGYSGLMYAKKVLENPRWAEHGFNLYKNRKEDWNEFKESKLDSLDDFIKNKYFT
ncbi:MAG: hypothetical protein O3C35_04180 [Proteobacteria bacterium]|nr:hypothetical protein [Pseudomonadota bacterium]